MQNELIEIASHFWEMNANRSIGPKVRRCAGYVAATLDWFAGARYSVDELAS